MNNTTNTQREYASKKEYAFDLFAENWSVEDVAELLEIKENTSKTYYQLYKKENGLVKSRTTKPKEVEVKETKATSKISAFEKGEVEFEIGSSTYTINHYKDLKDGTVWFDFIKIIEAIKVEKIADIEQSKICIADRYLRDELINGSYVHMIDKNALIDLARTVNDFTLTTSIMNYLISDFNYFYKFGCIAQSFGMIADYLEGIDNKYNEVKAFNDFQTDLLHEIDNNPYASKEERWERFEKIESIRHARRAVKNELVLSQSVRGLLKYHDVNIKNVRFMNDKLYETIYALYHKNYNPRAEQLDEAQRELVFKTIEK